MMAPAAPATHQTCAIGIEPGGQIDIGQSAHRAHQAEQHKTAQRRQALQLPVAIGQFIVEEEIAGHRHQSGDDLGDAEKIRLGRQESQASFSTARCTSKAQRADNGEEYETRVDQIAG